MEPYQAASPSNRNMIFTWIVRRALHVNAILIKSQSHYAVMLYIFFWWGGQRGWVEGSHCENVPVKNNAYLFSFYKGNFSFSYFSFICGRIDCTHFFLFTYCISETTSLPPSKSQMIVLIAGGWDTQCLLGQRPSFCLFFRQRLLATENFISSATGSQ